MNIPEFLLTIIDRLQISGHQAYIVGGAVRDMLLHLPITDWDVATSAPPEKISTIFRDLKNFSLKHGTVTLVDGAQHYEVTTFKGSERFGRTIEEDLKYRDFTINAMAYDLDKKEILDPNRGKEDILRKRIRAVGEPEDRFREDPLRLLRAVRFATELNFKIERKTLETISMMSEQIGSVAQERIRDELLKILMGLKPSSGFNLMFRTNLLKQVLPELCEGYLKRQNAYHRYTIYKHIMETIDQVQPRPVLRLTALLHDIAKPRVREKVRGEWRFLGHEKASAELAREIMERLKFSKAIMGRVTNLITHHMIWYDSGWSDGAVRRLIRRVGSKNIDHLLIFRRADILAHGLRDEKLDQLSELEKRVGELKRTHLTVKTRDLAIDGKRVMEILSLSPGP
ncbi:MAG: CCA tRNA nucleotidyltransferase, partial [Deltaproteobacteria bacterium]|nr:CCA tRNA nucleotidyltransferase [Deltaproteobacteria bacterium]